MYFARSCAVPAALWSLMAATATAAGYDPAAKTNVALYYGQGPAEASTYGLAHFCASTSVDIIPLAFLNKYLGQANGYPGTNFGGSCWGTVYSGPGPDHSKDDLQNKCPTLVSAIPDCQNTYGKKILLSLGGWVPQGQTPYQLLSVQDAEDLADFLWSAFGPADSSWTGPRPFDTEGTQNEVDGFDFDIEITAPGEQAYYIALLNRLRSHFPTGPGCKEYIISGAPQCLYPDANMALMITSTQFDVIWTQYYNTPQCSARNWIDNNPNYSSTKKEKPSGFKTNYDKFVKSLQGTPSENAKLYLGLLGSTSAGTSTDYLDPDTEVKPLIQAHYCNQNFGGVMIWEAMYATTITEHQNTFFEEVKAILLDVSQDGSLCSASSSSSSTMTATTSSSTSSSSSLSTTSTPYSTSSSSVSMSSTIPSSTSTSHSTSSSIASTSSTSSLTTSSGVSTSSSASFSISSTMSTSASSSESASSSASYGANVPTSSSASASASSSESSSIPSSASSSASSSESYSISSSASSSAPSSESISISSSASAAASSSATTTYLTTSSSASSSSSLSNGTWTSPSLSASASSSESSPCSTTSSSADSLSSGSTSTSFSASAPSSTTLEVTSLESSASGSYSSLVSTTSSSSAPSTYPTGPNSTGGLSTSPTGGLTTSSNGGLSASLPGGLTTSSTNGLAATSGYGSSGPFWNSTSSFYTPPPASSSVDLSSASTSLTTMTMTTTSVYTITSCPPVVTNCPIGKVTTEIVTITTTFCPEAAASTSASTAASVTTGPETLYTISTVYTTLVYTVTSCAPTVTNCPAKLGQVTTEIVALYTTVCPVTAMNTPSPVQAIEVSLKPTSMQTVTISVPKGGVSPGAESTVVQNILVSAVPVLVPAQSYVKNPVAPGGQSTVTQVIPATIVPIPANAPTYTTIMGAASLSGVACGTSGCKSPSTTLPAPASYKGAAGKVRLGGTSLASVILAMLVMLML